MADWEIYFWEPSLSPHKLDLWRALGALPTVRLKYYIAHENLSAARMEQGWLIPEIPPAQVVIGPSGDEIRQIVASSSKTSIHLFSGVHWVSTIVQGIAEVIKAGRRFGLMCEPRVFEGARGWARFIHSWTSERTIRANVDFVLAIGRHGPSWFASVGYKKQRIFPFAYFVPPPVSSPGPKREGHARVTFAGRISRMKGIHLFLQALPLIASPIKVEVAGSGPEIPSVIRARDLLDVPLTFHGAVPMKEMSALMQRTDVLVLPSITTDDGWGAVVSEALLAGAAVVATECVGASVCIDNDIRGWVTRELTPSAIAFGVDGLANTGRLSEGYREQRRKWAMNRLTGDAGALYLMSILSHIYDGASRPRAFYE